MAIYKPTDCSPFNGTFDISNNSTDIPIFLECKVDTSNSVVNAYSIAIFNSENKQIFPTAGTKFADKVTLLADLKTYYENNYSSRGYRNLNTGLNGTYIRIPFIVNALSIDGTVKNNQMSRSGSSLQNGRSYRWQITLYQGVETGSGGKTPTIPRNKACYDMPVATGVVLGSTKKRIQTALIDSDDKVVDNLVLIDKYIQPLKLSDLEVSDWSNPKAWSNKDADTSGTVTSSGPRVLINTYDSTYGHIYPATSEDNALADGVITPNVTNAFQIYKNGNDPENLGTKDMVAFVVEYSNDYSLGGTNSPRDSKWTLSPDAATPGNSFWTQEYAYDSNLDTESSFTAFGSGYPAVSDGSRVILNAFDKDAVKINDAYKGSCYNGIYYLKNAKIFKPKSTEKTYPTETSGKWGSYTFKFAENIPDFYVAYAIKNGETIDITNTTKVSDTNSKEMTSTYYGELYESRFYIVGYAGVRLRWYRTPDANTWGSLSNKVVYAQNDGSNYQPASNVTAGSINKSPVLFVPEKPIRLFNTAELSTMEVDNTEIKPVGDNQWYVTAIADESVAKISTVTSVVVQFKTETKILSPSDYSYAPGDSYIYIYSDSKPTSATVSYTPYSENDYTGVIFYNDTTSNTRRVYIRPSTAIKSDMLLVKTNGDQKSVNITNYNSPYSYVEYTEVWGGDVKSDETRYQIKSFYKESDLNSFSFYADPTITIKCIDETNAPVAVGRKLTTRNFTATATYDPGDGNYIYWRSYYWTLSLNGQVLSTTPETYTGEITANFYGLESGNTYTLTLTLVINTGKVVTVTREIPVEFNEDARSVAINVGFECDTLSLSAQQLEAIRAVIIPEANHYDDKFVNGEITMSAEPDSTGNFIWQTENGIKVPIASIDIEKEALIIKSGNQVKYSKAAALPEIVGGAWVDLELNDDAEYFTVECQHVLSGAYGDELFSVTAGNNTVSISAPLFKEKTQDGVILSENRNKIMISRNGGSATVLQGPEMEDSPVLPNWLPSTASAPSKDVIVSNVAQISFTNPDVVKMSWQSPLAGRKNHPLILCPTIKGEWTYQIAFFVQGEEQPQDGTELHVYGDTLAMWGDYYGFYYSGVAGTTAELYGTETYNWIWSDGNNDNLGNGDLIWYDGEAFGIDGGTGEATNSYHSSLVYQEYHGSQYPNRNKPLTFKLTFDRELNLINNNSTYYISG